MKSTSKIVLLTVLSVAMMAPARASQPTKTKQAEEKKSYYTTTEKVVGLVGHLALFGAFLYAVRRVDLKNDEKIEAALDAAFENELKARKEGRDDLEKLIDKDNIIRNAESFTFSREQLDYLGARKFTNKEGKEEIDMMVLSKLTPQEEQARKDAMKPMSMKKEMGLFAAANLILAFSIATNAARRNLIATEKNAQNKAQKASQKDPATA